MIDLRPTPRQLCAQLGGDFLSASLTSKGLCRRIHFRRMPSVNDGPSDMPDSGFAATSLLAGSPTSRIFVGLAFCLFSRLALGLELLRSFSFCLCGRLHLRDPGSFPLCRLFRFARDHTGPIRSRPGSSNSIISPPAACPCSVLMGFY